MATPLEINARDWKFEVSSNGSVYTTISGVQNWGLKLDVKTADATNFADGGWGRLLTMGAQVTVMFDGEWLQDSSAGARDAGQSMVDGAAGLFGVSGLLYYKVSHVGVGWATDVLTFRASAKLNDTGGKNNDLMPWGVELSVYGKPTGAGAFSVMFP